MYLDLLVSCSSICELSILRRQICMLLTTHLDISDVGGYTHTHRLTHSQREEQAGGHDTCAAHSMPPCLLLTDLPVREGRYATLSLSNVLVKPDVADRCHAQRSIFPLSDW